MPLVCQVSCCSASYSDVDLCQVPQQIAVVSELGVLFFLSFFPYYKGGKKNMQRRTFQKVFYLIALHFSEENGL